MVQFINFGYTLASFTMHAITSQTATTIIKLDNTVHTPGLKMEHVLCIV